MKNDPCSIATDYAVSISKCQTIAELEAIGQVIKANLKDVVGYEEWLRDIYFSKLNYDLMIPDVPLEDKLNAAGKKALKRGEL